MSRKLSRTVLSGGKGGDNIKALPITINHVIARATKENVTRRN
ncbi:hypothetical protein [Enterococcus durans]|nr:hypothetical protein [Enterococcus durans]